MPRGIVKTISKDAPSHIEIAFKLLKEIQENFKEHLCKVGSIQNESISNLKSAS